MGRISETDLILNSDGSVYHLNLLPGNIAETIVTVGDPDRVALVSQFFDTIEFKKRKREFITHSGTCNGKKVTVISTGIGTDNIELVMTELDALLNIDFRTRLPKPEQRKLRIIRIGTSGAIQENIAVGSYVASDYAVGFDALMNFYSLPMTPYEQNVAADLQAKAGLDFKPYAVQGSPRLLGEIGFDMLRGNTVTCPGFYAPQGRSVRVPTLYPVLIEILQAYRRGDFLLTNAEMETAGYYAMARLLGHEALSVNAILANRISNEFSENPDEVVAALIRKVLDRL